MKFFIKKKDIKPDPKLEWHDWFAWYPIKINIYDKSKGLDNVIVWLKTVDRKKIYYYGQNKLLITNPIDLIVNLPLLWNSFFYEFRIKKNGKKTI